MCEGGYTIAPLASCVGDASTITVTYSFGGSTRPPTQTTFVGIYPLTETGPFKALASGAVCGSTYPKYVATANGGLCPTTGTFRFSPPSVPGQYKIVVVPFSPPNAQGMSGFYALQDSNIIGQFTVLPSGCAASDKTAALANNNAGALLSSRLAAETTAQASALATMKSRLDAIKPLLATLTAELPASLTITGLDPTTRRVWAGTLNQMCYRIPPSANVNPKNLVLYDGDGSSGSYYPTALGAAGNAALPADYQGCTNFVASTGVPVGPYTIVMQDSTTSTAFTEISFNLVKASVAFSALVPGAAALTLTTTWNIPAELATVNDMVKVTNSQGTVVFWYYTSCKCQTAPGAAPVPTGLLAFRLLKLNSVPGGYTLTLNPGGGNVVAAVGPNWIPWAKLGY